MLLDDRVKPFVTLGLTYNAHYVHYVHIMYSSTSKYCSRAIQVKWMSFENSVSLMSDIIDSFIHPLDLE